MAGDSIGAVGRRRAVDFRGGRVMVDERGEGPTVGYLHGPIGCPPGNPFLDLLAERHHVVAPSLPGCTGSDARDDLRTLHDWVVAVSEIAELAGMTGHPLVASSTGAMLALELAAVRPEAFTRLILVSPLGLWVDDDPVADPFGTTLTGQRGLLTADPARTAPFFDDVEGGDAAGLADDAVVRYSTRTVAASLVWPIPEFGLASRLHLVGCPVTLVWGAEDRLNPPSYLERYAAHLSNVEASHVVATAGHLVEWDAPAAVAEVVSNGSGVR
ncbi:MAG: alpha/beta fold hydrolase [Ilumatobacteraceae bacterium]